MLAQRFVWFGVLVLAAASSAPGAQQSPSRGRPPPGFPGRGSPGAPASAAPTDPLSGASRATSAPPLDLSGTWKGMFGWDVSIELADLVLTASPDGRELTGELQFSPIKTEANRTMRPGPPVVWTLRGRVDPGSGAVWLAPPPPGIPTGPRAEVEPRPLGAVFSSARNELAGQFQRANVYMPRTPDPTAAYFLFVRAGDGKDRADAVARIQSLAQHAAEAAPPVKARSGGSAPGDGDLVKWASPYEAEFGTSAGTGGVETISQRAMPILADAAFRPVFGETYDRIDFGVLQAGVRRFNDPKLAREHGFLQYALWPSPSKLVAVAAMRTIDAWQAETLARFRSGTPVASAFDDLAAAQKAMQDTVVYAFPSARKRTDEEIEKLRGTLSGSSLGANVDAAIASAAGIEGARKLAAWTKENGAMLQRLSPEERQAAQAKVDAKLDELLVPLIEEQTARLAGLGTGEPAVRAGVAWYKSYAAQFEFAAGRPPYAQGIAKLASRREGDLAAGSGTMTAAIQASRTPEEVDSIFAGDLAVPGDEKTKPYPALADAAAKRKQKIEEERILALFSPEEKAIMDRPGHLDLARAKPRPPTAEEVRLAMVRGWAFGTGRVIDAHTARYVDMVSSQVMFFPFPVKLQFTQENLLRAEPIGKSGDWSCDFTILVQMSPEDDNALLNYDDVVKKQSATMLQMVNAVAATGANEPETKVLRLTEHGWVIPELMDAGALQGAIKSWLKVR